MAKPISEISKNAAAIASGDGPLRYPRATPQRPDRAPQETVPPTREAREALREAVREYVDSRRITPPIPFSELREHADRLVAPRGEGAYRDYAAILINNEAWRDILASIPYERRLLLLPVCLRDEAVCPAPFDEFGLLCKECGQCSIHDLKLEAERLGYPMLIAEGTPIVMQMIETGQIEAVVGVSCLNVLERVFPYMEAAAVPGVAIPLLQDDCKDTNIDIEWLWDIIHLTSSDKTYRMDLDRLQKQVDVWFSAESLAALMPGEEDDDSTAAIARDWLGKDGKRWRPFLTACTYQAYQDDPEAEPPSDLGKIAVAVECFHKASLIHDDIEDEDVIRYGESTVHAEYGVAVALNVGDFLIGEGYRLLAETAATHEQRANMLHVAALGHRMLSVGQGAELIWARRPEPLKSRQVLNIFRHKTAPAFEVALRVGAIYANADASAWDVIGRFSEALGVAYQIRDDIDDIFGDDSDSNDAEDVRPSLLLSMAWEQAEGADRELMDALWRKQKNYVEVEGEVRRIMKDLDVLGRAGKLLDAYQEEAVRSLATLENATIKGLLRRVLAKIFDQLPTGTSCSEFASGDAAGGETVAEATG